MTKKISELDPVEQQLRRTSERLKKRRQRSSKCDKSLVSELTLSEIEDFLNSFLDTEKIKQLESSISRLQNIVDLIKRVKEIRCE